MKLRYAAVLLLALAGCQNGTNPPPLVLGQVANLSGSGSAGRHAEQGIGLALKQLADVNLAEGLNGRSLEVRHTDTRGQPAAYESEAVRLVNVNRVIGLIGGRTPDEVRGLDRGHIPLLALTGARPAGVSEQTFAIGLSPEQQTYILARFAAEQPKVGTPVVLADERREDFVARADAFARHYAAARKEKGEPLVPLRFGKDTKWDDLAKTIAERKPQAIVFAGTVRDWNELRPRLPAAVTLLFAGDGGDAAELLGTGPIFLATTFVADPAAPRSEAFVRQYREAFKADPDGSAALGYEALELAADALKRISPTFSPDRLQGALLETRDFPGLAGPLTMTTDRVLQRPLYLVRLEDGERALVKRYEPADLR